MKDKFKLILLSLLLLLQSCGINNIELVSNVEKSYNENKTEYHFLRNFFNTTNDSISRIYIGNSEIRVFISTSIQPIIVNSKEEIKNLKEIEDHEALLDCIVIMENLSLKLVGGTNDKTVFNFNDGHLLNCYSFYYDKYFTPDDSFESKKIANFKEDKKPWIYMVDEQWYIQKSKCLN